MQRRCARPSTAAHRVARTRFSAAMPSTQQALRLPLALLAAALLLAAAAAPASARSPIRVGIGDQSHEMFDSPHYQALNMKMTRYFFPWNGMHNGWELTKATRFVERAHQSGVSVLLHISTDTFELRKAKLPTVKAYTAELKRIVPYFRARGVKEWGVWNEANHASQPTYRNPVRAAQFFRAMYQVVGSKERIVALDVLDQGGVDRYQRRWFAALSPTYRSRAKIIGLHNYGDVNRVRSTYTALMIRTARRYNRKARFWFTETGGIVEFGRSFRCSTSRAASRTRNVLTLAKRYRGQGVDRVYFYNWTGSGCGKTRFDAGFTTPSGQPRQAYRTLRALLPSYSR